MPKITANEVSQIVERHITNGGGVTASAMLGAWREIADRILDGLDGWHNREVQFPLAKLIIGLWYDVVLPASGPEGDKIFFSGNQLVRLRMLYLRLDNIATRVSRDLYALPEDNLASREDIRGWLNEVSEFAYCAAVFVGKCPQGSGIAVAGRGFAFLEMRCMAFMSIVLGNTMTAQFKEQYDLGAAVTKDYLRMGRMRAHEMLN